MRRPLILTSLLLLATTVRAADNFVSFARDTGMTPLTGTTDTIVYDKEEWKGVVIAVNNLRWLSVTTDATPGRHTLRLIMIDPEIVVEQLVINPDNAHYSYFGAPAR